MTANLWTQYSYKFLSYFFRFAWASQFSLQGLKQIFAGQESELPPDVQLTELVHWYKMHWWAEYAVQSLKITTSTSLEIMNNNQDNAVHTHVPLACRGIRSCRQNLNLLKAGTWLLQVLHVQHDEGGSQLQVPRFLTAQLT